MIISRRVKSIVKKMLKAQKKRLEKRHAREVQRLVKRIEDAHELETLALTAQVEEMEIELDSLKDKAQRIDYMQTEALKRSATNRRIAEDVTRVAMKILNQSAEIQQACATVEDKARVHYEQQKKLRRQERAQLKEILK